MQVNERDELLRISHMDESDLGPPNQGPNLLSPAMKPTYKEVLQVVVEGYRLGNTDKATVKSAEEGLIGIR
ncbi:hypothetical protein U1Q18_011850 [Sarracenia purpurea var. burkii]